MTPKVLCLESEIERLHAAREFSAMTVKALKLEIVPSNGGKQDKRIFQNHIFKSICFYEFFFSINSQV